MRISKHLDTLKTADWSEVLRNKKNKKEISENIVGELQKHYSWLKVGMQKLPEKPMCTVLPTNEAKELIELIVEDWPRMRSFNDLDRQICDLSSEITKPLTSESKKDQDALKSKRRKLAILKKQIAELDATDDSRRLDIAAFMAFKGIDYIKRAYEKVMPDNKEALEHIKQLEANQALLSKLADQLPELRFIFEKKREWQMLQIEKMKREKKAKAS